MDFAESVALVVPCYNEATRLQLDLFTDYLHKHKTVTFIFVNDGSTDSTLEVLSAFCNEHQGRAKVVSLEKNSGKAEAVRCGVTGLFGSQYEYIGYWDADLSTPLEELYSLLSAMKSSNADLVLASRVKILGHQIDRHLYRHLAGRVFATLASQTLNLPVYDTQCGAKLFVNSMMLEIAFADPFITNWSFDVEILMRHKVIYELREDEMNIIEVPVRSWSDVPGSKVHPMDFLSEIYGLWRIYRYYRRNDVVSRYREALSAS